MIGAPLLFGGPRFTVARLVVPSAELLSLHADAHEAALPHLVARADGAHSARGVDSARDAVPADGSGAAGEGAHGRARR